MSLTPNSHLGDIQLSLPRRWILHISQAILIMLFCLEVNVFGVDHSQPVLSRKGWLEGQLPFGLAFHLFPRPQHGDIFALQPGLDHVIIMRAAQLPRLP